MWHMLCFGLVGKSEECVCLCVCLWTIHAYVPTSWKKKRKKEIHRIDAVRVRKRQTWRPSTEAGGGGGAKRSGKPGVGRWICLLSCRLSPSSVRRLNQHLVKGGVNTGSLRETLTLSAGCHGYDDAAAAGDASAPITCAVLGSNWEISYIKTWWRRLRMAWGTDSVLHHANKINQNSPPFEGPPFLQSCQPQINPDIQHEGLVVVMDSAKSVDEKEEISQG